MGERVSSVCPCKTCTVDTGRHVGCHGTCEPYIIWHNNLRSIKEAYKKENDIDKAVTSLKDKRIKSLTHYKKQK